MCLKYVVAGVSDASAGALIPYMQPYFHIGYMTVSTLFVGQCVGFILASLSNTYLTDRFGIGIVITWGAFQQTIAYSLMAPPINFPLIVVCYAINGFGMALQDAAANAYIGGTGGNVAWKMGLLHAFYGLGALISPLIATAFVSSGIKFSFFWLVTLGLGIVNVLLLLLTFRLKREAIVEDETPDGQEGEELGSVGTGGEVLRKQVQEDDHKAKLKRILTDRNVLILATFILVYVGTEVSIGGWIVSFVIDERSGGHSAGYVATGFWAGITLGRLLCPKLNMFVGEKKIIFYYLGIAIALEFTIWFVESLPGNAVAVAVVGFVLGPFYPNAMSISVKILPRSLHSGAIGFIAAFGQQGAALFPFITGALAQRYSTNVLQPIILILCVTMAGLWCFVKIDKKKV
ncbi:MFS general substrate transporter [Atractiella rhizophila]|nr:MFS general substrate transporter [Atractiella rhizophila]